MTGAPPPKLARRMLARALPADAREHVVDELDEVYHRMYERQGAAQARRWYWREALSFTGGFLVERLRERSAGRHPIAVPIQNKRGPIGSGMGRFATEATETSGGNAPLVPFTTTGGDYFKTMGIPLVSGRLFERSDHVVGMSNALVSRMAAQRFWPNEDPIGKRFRFSADPATGTWLTVVGVVGDVRLRDFRQAAADPMVYLALVGPTARSWAAGSPAYVVKSPRADSLAPDIRALLREYAPEAPMYRLFNMEILAGRALAQLSFTTLMLAIVWTRADSWGRWPLRCSLLRRLAADARDRGADCARRGDLVRAADGRPAGRTRGAAGRRARHRRRPRRDGRVEVATLRRERIRFRDVHRHVGSDADRRDAGQLRPGVSGLVSGSDAGAPRGVALGVSGPRLAEYVRDQGMLQVDRVRQGVGHPRYNGGTGLGLIVVAKRERGVAVHSA